MEILTPDELHRTIKLEIDEERATTFVEAYEIVSRYVLQIYVGHSVVESETRQVALLTAINAGSRAFIGGVRVFVAQNGPMSVRWSQGHDIAASIAKFGGSIVSSLSDQYPTLVIGDVAEKPPGKIVLFATWQGWSGGVVKNKECRLAETFEFPLAGVLTAALGISEAFQNIRGHVVAGRRSIGLSLWAPQLDWRSAAAFGAPNDHLPSRLWIVGLGHLGQAYAWALGALPYDDPSNVCLLLQDYDSVVKANESTGMLSDKSAIGQKKSRVVASRLETLGFSTFITERPLDCSTRRRGDEPGLALVGVDDTAPRRLLEQIGFDVVIDAGMGGNPHNYLDILIHVFPSGIQAVNAWPENPERSASPVANQSAYQNQLQQLKDATELDEGEIWCGILDVAGRSVGAAFVGCVAATLVIAEALRYLAGGPNFEVLSLSLRSPDVIKLAENTCPGPSTNPGFVAARAAS